MLLSKATYNKCICHENEATQYIIVDNVKKEKIETIFKPSSEHRSCYLSRIPSVHECYNVSAKDNNI